MDVCEVLFGFLPQRANRSVKLVKKRTSKLGRRCVSGNPAYCMLVKTMSDDASISACMTCFRTVWVRISTYATSGGLTLAASAEGCNLDPTNRSSGDDKWLLHLLSNQHINSSNWRFTAL
ncbi:hypothetical protein CRM22_005629 [Opisthorchis felineus]|uniref:Uncharacterized protein n=1 Tax=Opisthorchis felineus TaxID=147828 RepID=A0A4S2LQB1_OPIFE|nr:hypothetical protein CRM22_005629 [Opisthorchis felineus]